MIHVTTLQDEINPSDGLTSLREAVALANATPGSQIVLDCPGVYRLSVADPWGDGTTDLDITADVSIKPADHGTAQRYIIDGNYLDRIFDIHGAVDVAIQNLTLRNGLVDGDGGAINVEDPGATLSLQGMYITNNMASGVGGAISAVADAGPMSIDRSFFFRNNSGEDGGAVNDNSASLGSAPASSAQPERRLRRRSLSGGSVEPDQPLTRHQPVGIPRQPRHGGGRRSFRLRRYRRRQDRQRLRPGILLRGQLVRRRRWRDGGDRDDGDAAGGGAAHGDPAASCRDHAALG